MGLIALLEKTLNTHLKNFVTINFFIALFNLALPISSLDGAKIFFGSRILWLFSVIFLVSLFLLFQLGFLFALIIAAILSFAVIVGYYIKFGS